MKATKMKTIALIILLATRLLAQTRPAVELEGAIAKEQVDGDLKTAIAIYQKIAADTSAPRDLRARALLHQARCYEKLGQQAQTLYRQIVRDFGDQPEAVQAKARLAALREADHPAVPAGMTQRKIETPPDMAGMYNEGTDGRRAVYRNLATEEVIYGDLARNSMRVIFKPKLGDQAIPVPSRDFRVVLIILTHPSASEQETLAVVNIDGTGYREIAHVDAKLYGSWNWSWDDRYILLSGRTQEGTNTLLKISVADGQARQLLTPKAGNISVSAFSPDGRFVAYQVAPSDADHESRIFVLPAEGGEPRPVYEERLTTGSSQSLKTLQLLDWTADGRYLAIASGRTGKGSLYLVAIKDGKSAGAPVFVTYGDFEDGLTTTAGGLVYSSAKPGGPWSVYLASLDSNTRPGDWKRLDLHLGNVWTVLRWSGDSNQIVYIARHEDKGWNTGANSSQVVHVHNLSTGEDREIYHSLGDPTCTWAVQQPKLFCADYAAEKTEIFSIAVDSGEITRIHTFPAKSELRTDRPSRNDRALYLYRSTSGGWELLRWEIATGQETVLEVPARSQVRVSSDERWLFRWTKQNIEIRPTSGGDWKPLVSPKIQVGNHFNFTPDGDWLLYHDVDSTGKHSLFRVATAGGTPERLGDFPTNSPYGTVEISPDGRKILVSAGEFETGYELWSLENFVPPAPKR